MGADDVEVGLRDDAHSEIVEGAGEEAGKGGGEGHAAISASDADANLFPRRLVISPK